MFAELITRLSHGTELTGSETSQAVELLVREDIPVELKQQVEKGHVIGILKNAFGDVIDTYYAPEAGIVIGKSTNPVNMTGGRIIHLGILK